MGQGHGMLPARQARRGYLNDFGGEEVGGEVEAAAGVLLAEDDGASRGVRHDGVRVLEHGGPGRGELGLPDETLLAHVFAGLRGKLEVHGLHAPAVRNIPTTKEWGIADEDHALTPLRVEADTKAYLHLQG